MGRKQENAPVPRNLGQRFPAFLDRGDPNYDSQEEEISDRPSVESSSFLLPSVPVRDVEGVAEEFLSSRDVDSLVSAVEELPSTRTLDDFVARLLRLSLDRDDRDRQTALQGLAKLKTLGILGDDQISRGFDKIAITIDDVRLDVPLAPGIFLGLVQEAIERKTLPRSFFFRLPESLLKLQTLQDENTETTARQLLEELRKFKRRAKGVIEEVFAGGRGRDAANVAEDVKEALMIGNVEFPHGNEMKHEFVKIAIVASMDKNDDERELISALFVALGNFLSEADFIRAFARLVVSIDDLRIDVPDASDLLARFLFRALADDLLPPGFIETLDRLRLGGDSGRLLLAHVRAMFNSSQISDHRRASAALRVQAASVWTRAKETQTKEAAFKGELQLAISEFFDSHDAGEFVRLLSEWEMDSVRAGEVVRKLLISAMEKTGTECQLVVKLINKALHEEKLLTAEDVISGFNQIHSRIQDIKLDIPDVDSMLASFKSKLKLNHPPRV